MRGETLELPFAISAPSRKKAQPSLSFAAILKDFRDFGQRRSSRCQAPNLP
jgi:hypothetical protein